MPAAIPALPPNPSSCRAELNTRETLPSTLIMVCIAGVRALPGAGNFLFIICRVALGSFNASAVKVVISKTR